MRTLPLVLAAATSLATAVRPAPLAAQGTPSTASAPSARGHVLVLEKNAATARLLDPTTGATVATMPTGPFPHEVVVSPDARWAVVADYGGPTPGHTLTVLDLASRAVARTIDLGEYRRPHGLVWLPGAGARVAVTSEQSRHVVLVDVAAGRVERAIPTEQNGTHMVALAPDGRRAYTANIGSGSVTALDLGAGRAVATKVTGRGPEGIDVTPDGRELWAADRTLNRITILDAATLDSLGSIPTGAFPNRLRFTPDGRWALVSNAAAGTVGVYDVKARVLAATIAMPADSSRAPTPSAMDPSGRSAMPLGILVSPDGRRAWIATAAEHALVEVDVAARRVVRVLKTGDTPDGMAWVPAARR